MSKGYKCPYCRTWNSFDAYVFAHWKEELIGTCKYKECGKKISLCEGKVQFDKMLFAIEDLTNVEALIFNEIIKEFNDSYREQREHLRVGQAWYNRYYKEIYGGEPNGRLFYEEDNHISQQIIVRDLVNHLKQREDILQ